MKRTATFLILLFATFAPAQEQSAEQKLLMDKHKNVLLNSTNEDLAKASGQASFDNALKYLVVRKASAAFVEDQVVRYREAKMWLQWHRTVKSYFSRYHLEDCPDRLLPDVFKAYTEYKMFATDYVCDLGVRAAPLAPHFEAVLANPKSKDADVKAARVALVRIKNP